MELTFTVKTYDIDFANIVHNAVYIRWLEDLRQQILVDHMPIEEMLAQQISPILTRTEIDYRRPVQFGDEVSGRMWVQELGRTRWIVSGEIVSGETVAAAAVQSGYFANLETLAPVRVPQKLRQAWERHQAHNKAGRSP
ncbi:MAG TPA: thioesterase family protein [Candidatus Sulfomarinibacteraceae bacterium]|nr:thioesterase family protein [Candidatus Sulfomarinibacteraceae bacterium]